MILQEERTSLRIQYRRKRAGIARLLIPQQQEGRAHDKPPDPPDCRCSGTLDTRIIIIITVEPLNGFIFRQNCVVLERTFFLSS